MSNNDKKQALDAVSFIEELIWVIESRKSLKLNKIAPLLRDAIIGPSSVQHVGSTHTSPNPNIHYLIGVLPRLFQDEKLFPNNLLIADFAKDVLGVSVTRSEKRSKYELIGLIVCETDKLNDEKLAVLVHALAELTRNESKLNKIRAATQSGQFSWNDTIRQLSNNSNI